MKIPENTVIHCPTEELANKVLTALNFLGYTYYSGLSLLLNNYWSDYINSYCINEHQKISYSPLVFYEQQRLKIISAEDFIKSYNKIKAEELYDKIQELAKFTVNTLPYLAVESLTKIKKQYNMEKKEIKVEVPEGMEVDLEKSIMNEHEVSIVYKAIKKYEDYRDVCPYSMKYTLTIKDSNNIPLTDCCDSEKQLKKITAINQLQNIANYYNKGWEINWDNANQEKHCIYYVKQENKFKQTAYTTLNLAQVFFANKQDAQSVIDNPNFRKILDKIYK